MNHLLLLPSRLLVPCLTLLTATVIAQPASDSEHLVHLNPAAREDIELAASFLNDAVNGQFELAHQKLAANLSAYGMPANQASGTDHFLTGFDRSQQFFLKQKMAVRQAFSFLEANADEPESWVYLHTVWSARDSKNRNKHIEQERYYLLQVRDHTIALLYSSTDQNLPFYPLGLTFSGVAAKMPVRER